MKGRYKTNSKKIHYQRKGSNENNLQRIFLSFIHDREKVLKWKRSRVAITPCLISNAEEDTSLILRNRLIFIKALITKEAVIPQHAGSLLQNQKEHRFLRYLRVENQFSLFLR